MKVNVIDLDKTLVPFDSSREFVKYLIENEQSQVKYFYVVARLTRLISHQSFMLRMVTVARGNGQYASILDQVEREIMARLDDRVLQLALQHTDSSTTNVLCTASLLDYAGNIGKNLKWEVIASEIKGAHYCRNHGSNKLRNLVSRFPESVYEYNMAISDAVSDRLLLTLFRHPYVVDAHCIRPLSY